MIDFAFYHHAPLLIPLQITYVFPKLLGILNLLGYSLLVSMKDMF